MKKRQPQTSQPVRKKKSLTRPLRRLAVLVLAGLICISLALITIATILVAVWLAISGEWDGSIEILDKSIVINPTLATALAWATVVTLSVATLSFYYLIISMYKRG